MTSYITGFFRELRIAYTNNPGSPPPSTGPLPKCRFPLGTESSAIMTLPDGRKLGYAQYGSLTGKPIIFLDGMPGSRLEGAFLDDVGKELGARIIGVDRPGMGWSTPQPGRKLLDFPKDVEKLTEHLGLESYSVMGVSGGGPPALACAYALPAAKLKSVSLVCGMGPPDIGMKGADFAHKLGFPYGFRYGMYWMGRLFWRQDATGRVELSDDERLEMYLKPGNSMEKASHPTDHDIIRDKDILRMSLGSTRQAFANGYDTIWDDGRLMCLDFGFKLAEIRKDLPVKLWYGKHDVFVPPVHGYTIAARIGESAELRMEDEAHSGIFLHKRKEILEAMLKHM